MPKQTKSPNGKGVVAVLMLTMLGAGVLAAYVRFSPQAARIQPSQQGPDIDVSVRSRPSMIDADTMPSNQGGLLVPAVVGNDVKLDKPAGTPPEGVTPEVHLLNQTLNSLKIDKARALGVDVQNHVAMVNFNPAIEKGYGSIEEGYLIKSLQMALGQFKDIDKFQVVVEGKTVESLGNIDLSAPIDVIRPDEKLPPMNSGTNQIDPG